MIMELTLLFACVNLKKQSVHSCRIMSISKDAVFVFGYQFFHKYTAFHKSRVLPSDRERTKPCVLRTVFLIFFMEPVSSMSSSNLQYATLNFLSNLLANRCVGSIAHNSRIYNRAISTRPQLISSDVINPQPRYNGLYQIMLSMKYLRPTEESWTDFVNNFKLLLSKYTGAYNITDRTNQASHRCSNRLDFQERRFISSLHFYAFIFFVEIAFVPVITIPDWNCISISISILPYRCCRTPESYPSHTA